MAISVQQVHDAGVVGAGGGGFPTHVKLAGKADTVLINAAECEPLLHKDKEVCLNYADEVLAGLAAAMQLTGASRGIIGIKAKYAHVIEALQPRLQPGGIGLRRAVGKTGAVGDAVAHAGHLGLRGRGACRPWK